MSQKKTPLFEKISISEAIFGFLCAVMGLVLIINYMFDDRLPWVLYVLNAAVLFSTGVYRIRWALYRRKETINGKYFCYPTPRGLYTKITNEVFYLFPIMNTLIMAFHRITDIVTLIMLVGISAFLAIWTSYGVKYSRSKLLVIQNDGVMLSKGLIENEYPVYELYSGIMYAHNFAEFLNKRITE